MRRRQGKKERWAIEARENACVCHLLYMNDRKKKRFRIINQVKDNRMELGVEKKNDGCRVHHTMHNMTFYSSMDI